MAVPFSWRRVRRDFDVSAPPVAVRSRRPWWGRAAIMLGTGAVIAGMWWWGIDFEQVFGGFDRQAIETRLAGLDAEAARLRVESGELRIRNSRLESDLAMSRGAEQALAQQVAELAAENVRLKDETTFLQKVVADSSNQAGLSIPKFSIDREGDAAYRYSLIVVRGGNPRGEFEGHVWLQAEFAPDAPATTGQTVTLPEDQPDSKAALSLKFKYYQRVEGTLRVPPGLKLAALTAKAYENGNASPRVTRTLTNP